MIAVGKMEISLNNLFLIVRNMLNDEREKAVVDFFESIVPSTPHDASTANLPYSTTKMRVLPQIVPTEFKETAPDLLYRPFFSGLGIAYTLDSDGTYELLQQPILAAWGVKQEALEAQAIANLEALCKSQASEPKRRKEGAFLTIAAEDSYSAARLLLPQFMRTLRDALDAPRIFVGIPNRDFFVAWTPDFSRRQAFAAKIRSDVENEPYPLTDDLFVSSETGINLMSADELRDHGR
jgi:uncharacterized protein YtpQ (UPF0354 family)